MSQINDVCALVRLTGKALLERLSHSDLNVRRKENNHQNLVTDFDIWVQGQLQEALHEIEPHAAFFAEEQVNSAVKGLTWIVDPIDGTTNFISTQRNYAICVALYEDTTPIFGVVYDVAADICYHATHGGTAYANAQALAKRAPVDFEDALFDASLTTMNVLSRRAEKSLYSLSCAARGHRAMGSASLAMCHIAEGTLDAYISHRLYPWDYAASGVILQACGGVFGAIYADEPLFTTNKAAVLSCGDPAMEKWLLPYLRGEGDLSTYCLSK
ncbi:MAG: inositol monophosphatase family protein [Peptococcaceae bacterium]|nr:inositol monophosphatase family protein [Peptococcaceae bacterium]